MRDLDRFFIGPSTKTSTTATSDDDDDEGDTNLQEIPFTGAKTGSISDLVDKASTGAQSRNAKWIGIIRH